MNSHVGTTIPASQARKDFFGILEKISSGFRYTITQNGYPKAVVVGAEEFESMMETLDVMRDHPRLLEEIEDARKDYAQGNYVTLKEFRQGKRTCDIPPRSASAGAKRTRSSRTKREKKD